MSVPDDLLLSFFRETTSRLLDTDVGAAIAEATTDKDSSYLRLGDCKSCVLGQQLLVLSETTKKYNAAKANSSDVQERLGSLQLDPNSATTHTATAISPADAQERLANLQLEPNLCQELKEAMESMEDAARIAVCKLILYSEEVFAPKTPRNLQSSGRLGRTELMEYFGLCQSALKLPCVLEFLKTTGATVVFSTNTQDGDGGDDKSSSALEMFPQSRLEHVQRMLAKGMGWDPAFVTAELTKIFVQKSSDVDYDYYDGPVTSLFQRLVEQMTDTIRDATLHIRSKQDTELLNDLAKGGNTRVLSVQYSEFDVDQHGNKIDSANNAPSMNIDEREEQISDEEKKRHLKLASQAAILQQTILGELFSMTEDERNETLSAAAETSRVFTEKVMALPPGPERIDFMRSVDPATSRKLAMHKLWSGMLQANGGQPPTIANQR